MRRPRRAARICALAAACIAVSFGLVGLMSSTARAGEWKYGGDSMFKLYYQAVPRVSNTTNLSLSGKIGPVGVRGQVKLEGASWGIPSDAWGLGSWGEWVERWNVALRAPSLSLQLGDTYIPTLSGLYLAGRSLHGGVGSAWGKVGGATGTATGFYGVNAVRSGLSISSFRVKGGSVEASLGRNVGLSVMGLAAERDGFDIGMGGVQVWAGVGPVSLSGEFAASKDNLADRMGYTALLGARMPAAGGRLSLSGQYTGESFLSLNSAVRGKAGGNAEASASWAGNILRTSGGHTLSLVVVGGLAADNIDASAGVRNMKDSAEGQLTLVSGQDQLVRGRYVISHEKSGEEPDPSRMKTNHVASIESAFPVKLGANFVDIGARASRSITVNHIDRLRDTLSILAVSAGGSIGQTKCTVKAGWSRSVKDATGAEKRDFEASLALSRPVFKDVLTAGFDASAVDSRAFSEASSEEPSVKDTLKAGLWLRYVPKPWVEATVTGKASWGWRGEDREPQCSDKWLEGELRFRF